jgi:hypothetical protein
LSAGLMTMSERWASSWSACCSGWVRLDLRSGVGESAAIW